MKAWSTATRAAQRARSELPIDNRDGAGDEGERLALAAFRAVHQKRGKVAYYPALRVPKTHTAGKHEIDLVVLSSEVLWVVEVKHWSGSIEREASGRFKQTGFEVKSHADHLALIAEKAADLVRYFELQGQPIDPQRVVPRLLFTHPDGKLSAALRMDPGVCTLAGLEQALSTQLPKRQLPAPLAWLWRGKAALAARFEALKGVLDRLPTWDLLTLRGGAVLKGDLRAFRLELKGRPALARARVSELSVRAPQRALSALCLGTRIAWRAAGGSRGGRGRALPDQSLTIALAGRSREASVPLEQVQQLRFGWQDERYYDPPSKPLSSYRRGQEFQGSVTGVTDFGVFVRFDGHRDGLIHGRRLAEHGQRPEQFQRGQPLKVRFVSARTRSDGKQEIELELA